MAVVEVELIMEMVIMLLLVVDLEVALVMVHPHLVEVDQLMEMMVATLVVIVIQVAAAVPVEMVKMVVLLELMVVLDTI